MKRVTILSLAVFVLFSCQKKESTPEEKSVDATSQIDKRACATMEVLAAQKLADPSIEKRMAEIEAFTQKTIANGTVQKLSATGAIEIPVVVHIVYNTAVENISDAQVQSQVDVLNEDFNLRNKDKNLIPDIFSPVKAEIGVKFVLSRTIRKKTTETSWGTNNAVKSSNRGGSDAVDPIHNLNIWVCNLGQDLLGYAQFPGQGNASTDGVVILYSAFGSRDKYRSGTYINRYDLGRTATHEVGHWLNLRHIWGDRTCGTDYVDDTPKATTANFHCPDFPHYNQCGDNAIEMTMNYMDYTQDACMYMFSNGQKDRMLAVFAAGGPRVAFAQ